MKKIVLAFVLFMICILNYFTAVSQSENKNTVIASKDSKEYYNFTKPYFPGKGYSNYIYSQMHVIRSDINNVKGKSSIIFKLSKNNTVSDIKVVDSSSSQNFNEQFYSAIAGSGGEWKPAKINGKPVDIMMLTYAFLGQYSMIQDAGYLITEYSFLIDNVFANDYYNEGVSLSSNNEFAEAVKCFNETLSITPNDIDALFNRGVCKYKNDDKAGACEDWKKIQSIGKEDADKLILKYCDK